MLGEEIMAYSKKRRRRIKKYGILGVIAAVILAIFSYLAASGQLAAWFSDEPTAPVDGEVEFHFIDVGQGDAALIRTSEGNVLIDAGTNASEDALIAYLKAEGITELAYAVFTHPHEDHIGGADAVLAYCEVEHVILSPATATTETYERMMDAIEEEDAEVFIAEPDTRYGVGDLKLTILGPIGSNYKDLNNDSVVLRADFGESSVLFTGDAEDKSEEDLLDRYALSGKLDCDVLKVGHHGSDSSTTEAFLTAVSPEMAVISCGEGNTYGHPTQIALNRLENHDVTYWRTDLEGSVVIVSDGEDLTKE